MSYGLIVRLWGLVFFLSFLWMLESLATSLVFVMLESLTTGGEENPKKKEKKGKRPSESFFVSSNES